MIAAGSTILFGITTYLMYRQMGNYPRLRWFTITTGVIFAAIAVIAVIFLTTGNQVIYDTYSVVLLLPVYLNTILAFVLLRGKK